MSFHSPFDSFFPHKQPANLNGKFQSSASHVQMTKKYRNGVMRTVARLEKRYHSAISIVVAPSICFRSPSSSTEKKGHKKKHKPSRRRQIIAITEYYFTIFQKQHQHAQQTHATSADKLPSVNIFTWNLLQRNRLSVFNSIVQLRDSFCFA